MYLTKKNIKMENTKQVWLPKLNGSLIIPGICHYLNEPSGLHKGSLLFDDNLLFDIDCFSAKYVPFLRY